jgi:phosphoribosylformylglycinamidine synthase
MISRDQMVGPWQLPVSDVAVTVADYFSTRGEAMAMGERTPLALLDPAASGRMAIAEAVTNIAAADVRRIEDIRLSANWMAACGEPGEDADLHDTVYAVGEQFCPALGIAIPVGKDSLSMRTVWREAGEERRVLAPVSLIVSAFAPVADVRRTLTPQLRLERGETRLLLVDLGQGRNRLGGSCLAQVYGRTGGLADTVQLWNPKTKTGTGVVFDSYDTMGLRWAIKAALDIYRDQPTYRHVQQSGMAQDFSWDAQVAKYERLYQS